jgi:hypothetical protein
MVHERTDAKITAQVTHQEIGDVSKSYRRLYVFFRTYQARGKKAKNSPHNTHLNPPFNIYLSLHNRLPSLSVTLVQPEFVVGDGMVAAVIQS